MSLEAQTCGLPFIDVYDSTNPGPFVLIGQIKTIQSAETGQSHYKFSSASGHPLCVNLQPRFANIWMHENTNDGDLTFGFIFSQDNGGVSNAATVNFRIVDSGLPGPFVSQSDDPGEAVETPAGSNAFLGSYNYGDNTDGIAVSGISGTGWTVIIDSVNFGNITAWFAAGGGTSNTTACTADLPDLPLTLGREYRLTPACNTPSGAPVVVGENQIPIPNAGPDQTVNEGAVVTLDGSGSSDPDGDDLTYAWTQVSGPPVLLSDDQTATPTFTAPPVSFGGEMLTFQLVVSDGELTSSPDTVDIMVKNVNHAPEADAGGDQTVNEGSGVTLSGVNSFDPDSDPLTYQWLQTAGPPVTLHGTNTATATCDAPFISGGVSGTAVLTFELTVSDSDLSSSDTVTVTVEQVNQPPTANAGADQTKNEGSTVTLNGSGSNDPDGDPISYSWSQVSGPLVTLSDDTSANPVFTAPATGPGSATLVFKLVVHDGKLDSDPDDVAINVQNIDDPPNCSLAQASTPLLWPPNHKLLAVGIVGVTDPDNDQVAITVTGVTQDEPVNGLGDGDTSPDAVLQGVQVLVRAERAGAGNGRVYHVSFTASDGLSIGGECSGSVTVCVPHDRKSSTCGDGGPLFNSLQP